MSEYFRTLLREAQERAHDSRLEALLLEGLAGGNNVTVDKEFWKSLRSEARELLAKHQAGKTRKK